MIKELIARFDEKRGDLLNIFKLEHPASYLEILQSTLVVLKDEDKHDLNFDLDRITEIDHSDYQGTLVFIIGCEGYQPSTYWATTVSYGSCSGCDTLEGIKNYSGEPPSEDEAKQYFTLAMHMIQEMVNIS